MANGAAATEATASTTSNAGWPAAFRAARTAARSQVAPLAVSVCTTNTLPMRCWVSARRAVSISAGSSTPPGVNAVRCTSPPSACTWSAQPSLKCPVPATSTVAPGATKLVMTASQPPWPLALKKNTSAEVPSSARMPVSQRWISGISRASARSVG